MISSKNPHSTKLEIQEVKPTLAMTTGLNAHKDTPDLRTTGRKETLETTETGLDAHKDPTDLPTIMMEETPEKTVIYNLDETSAANVEQTVGNGILRTAQEENSGSNRKTLQKAHRKVPYTSEQLFK